MKLKYGNSLNTTFAKSLETKPHKKLNKFEIHTMLTNNEKDQKFEVYMNNIIRPSEG